MRNPIKVLFLVILLTFIVASTAAAAAHIPSTLPVAVADNSIDTADEAQKAMIEKAKIIAEQNRMARVLQIALQKDIEPEVHSEFSAHAAFTGLLIFLLSFIALGIMIFLASSFRSK